MSAVALQDVAVAFGKTAVLDEISLHVEKGEFVSILGPSGAGKSTILRLLTGAVQPARGTVTCEGAPLAGASGTFAYMPQRDALMPWRRILDNAALGLQVQGVPIKAARKKVSGLMADFGLAGFERHYPAQLSGGMRQRAALLRTVVQDRPVQLLDEPFGALDALTRVTMQQWFADRWQAARWTTLLITHDVREAVALSDRIYVLSSRPARVIAEVAVPLPRPRRYPNTCPAAHALEAKLLNILMTRTGDSV